MNPTTPSTPPKGRLSNDIGSVVTTPTAFETPESQRILTFQEKRERNIAERDAILADIAASSPLSNTSTPPSGKKRRRGNFVDEHDAYYTRISKVAKIRRISLGRCAKEGLKKHIAPKSDESDGAEAMDAALDASLDGRKEPVSEYQGKEIEFGYKDVGKSEFTLKIYRPVI